MKFPGKRKTKHYFPVSERQERQKLENDFAQFNKSFVVGLEQILVDIEIQVSNEFLEQNNFEKGQSFIIQDELCNNIYNEFKSKNKIVGEYPGGSICNTLHNYSVISDSASIALGAINKDIQVGDYTYQYLCKTSSKVNLSYLQPSNKPIGRALCFVTPDGERTFAISKGCMDDYEKSSIPSDVIKNSVALLITAYTLRAEDSKIFESTIEACKIAKQNNVPIVFTTGTSSLIKEKSIFFKNFIQEYVSVLALNNAEAKSLMEIEDPLLCLESLLDIVDCVLLTVGEKGLYIGAHVDEKCKRVTKDPLHTKSIIDYNKFEYSRPMLKKDCDEPIKIYSHINPFMGGPMLIKNTNGAGDAALAALLHDVAANFFHKGIIPNSPKHHANYLTYSSLSQLCKYANRVSFEVLIQNSPRLYKGLPEKEDSLEEAYWDR